MLSDSSALLAKRALGVSTNVRYAGKFFPPHLLVQDSICEIDIAC